MGNGLITMITTADKQQSYGTNLEELSKYCIVNKYSSQEAETIIGGTFRQWMERFLKLNLEEPHRQEQLEVQEQIRRLMQQDNSREYLANPQAPRNFSVMEIECYRRGSNGPELIRSPRTGLGYAVLDDLIRDFLSTVTIDGTTYDHLDMVVDHKLVQGRTHAQCLFFSKKGA